MLTSPQRRRAPPAHSPDRRSGPANDNRRLRVVVPITPARLARYGSTLLRLNPYIRLAGMALDILEILSSAGPEGWQPRGGWVKVNSCPTPNPSYNGPWAANAIATNYPPTQSQLNTICFANQGRIAGSVGNPFAAVTANTRFINIGKSGGLGGARVQVQEQWANPVAGAQPVPVYAPGRAAIALPPPLPQYWPISLDPALAKPGQAPAFAPPVPWRTPPRLRGAPNRESSYGQGSLRRRMVAPATNPSSVPNEWSVAVGVGASAAPSAPKTHKMAQPTGTVSQVKETKAKLSPTQAVILKAVGMGTEGVDFIDAIYSALPEEYRPRFRNTKYELRAPTPFQKAQAIFENLEKIDISEAIGNLIYENIEDKFFGAFGKMGGEISKRLGRPYGSGMNSISSRIRKSTYDAEFEDYGHVDGEN